MARPNKEGLDYFPFDVDFFSDEKIGSISGEFGIKDVYKRQDLPGKIQIILQHGGG